MQLLTLEVGYNCVTYVFLHKSRRVWMLRCPLRPLRVMKGLKLREKPNV